MELLIVTMFVICGGCILSIALSLGQIARDVSEIKKELYGIKAR